MTLQERVNLRLTRSGQAKSAISRSMGKHKEWLCHGIGKIEARQVSLLSMLEIAEALGVHVSWLLDEQRSPYEGL